MVPYNGALYLTLTCICLVLVCADLNSRKPKLLVFPSSTILQAAVGISVPVDIEFFRISINWCFQANFDVPTKASDYTHGIGAGIVTYNVTNEKSRRRRELREVTTGELYRNLQSVLQDSGFNGEQCILKSICQLAQIPLHKHDEEGGDILAEILHLVLTPSEHNDNRTCCTMPYSNKVDSFDPDQIYLEAESRGAANANCSALYSKCPHSPLDLFTELEEHPI